MDPLDKNKESTTQPKCTDSCQCVAPRKDKLIFELSELVTQGKIYNYILKGSEEDYDGETVLQKQKEPELVKEFIYSDQRRPSYHLREKDPPRCGWERPVRDWKGLLLNACKPRCRSEIPKANELAKTLSNHALKQEREEAKRLAFNAYLLRLERLNDEGIFRDFYL